MNRTLSEEESPGQDRSEGGSAGASHQRTARTFRPPRGFIHLIRSFFHYFSGESAFPLRAFLSTPRPTHPVRVLPPGPGQRPCPSHALLPWEILPLHTGRGMAVEDGGDRKGRGAGMAVEDCRVGRVTIGCSGNRRPFEPEPGLIHRSQACRVKEPQVRECVRVCVTPVSPVGPVLPEWKSRCVRRLPPLHGVKMEVPPPPSSSSSVRFPFLSCPRSSGA